MKNITIQYTIKSNKNVFIKYNKQHYLKKSNNFLHFHTEKNVHIARI